MHQDLQPWNINECKWIKAGVGSNSSSILYFKWSDLHLLQPLHLDWRESICDDRLWPITRERESVPIGCCTNADVCTQPLGWVRCINWSLVFIFYILCVPTISICMLRFVLLSVCSFCMYVYVNVRVCVCVCLWVFWWITCLHTGSTVTSQANRDVSVQRDTKCDTLKTPEARSTLNIAFPFSHRRFIRLIAWSVSFPVSLSSLCSFMGWGRLEASHSLDRLKLSQLLWLLASDAPRALQSQVRWSSPTITYFRVRTSREINLDPDICPQIGARGFCTARETTWGKAEKCMGGVK